MIHIMISVQNLTKVCDGRTVLKDVSLSIHPGERLCIVGPSGTGKTLLLHLLLGLQKPTSGTIDIDGAPLRLLPPSILRLYHLRSGFIRQDDHLPAHETVFETVALPLILQNSLPALTSQKTIEVLTSLDLASRAQSFARDLAHGEQKLVSIARALISHPLLVFADEPLEYLDAIQSAHACNLFKKINSEGTTLILASRNSFVAQELHCRILTLKDNRLHGDDAPPPNQEASPKTTERSVKITAVK